MTSPATAASAVSVARWLAATEQHGRAEVVDGRLVVEEHVAGNAHNIVASLLATAFREQWACVAAAPGSWLVQGGDDSVWIARQPDVLVDGRALAESDVFRGVPDAVVEVWSPRNTLAEMNAKRREYSDAGAPVFVEAYTTDLGDVRLDWQVPTSRRGIWQTVATAAGDTPLVVDVPRPFHVVPNDLRGFPRDAGS